MMAVEITFTDPAQLSAFKRGLALDYYHLDKLRVVLHLPAPFDDVGGGRDALDAVPGPLAWRIIEPRPRPLRPTRRKRRAYRRRTP